MQVTETLSEGLRRAYSVTVPAAEIESKCGAKLAEISRTIRLPGFRPGKVPVNLVRQRYGASVMAEVMQDALTAAADQVVGERRLRPAGEPKISFAQQPEIKPGKPASDLSFNLEVDLLPEITAPDLAALTLTRLRAEVNPARVDEALATIAKNYRTSTVVEEDRGAETGEILTVDFVGSVDGENFAGGVGTDAKIEIGGSGFIPGFSEGMEGMKAGESRKINVTFPETYHAEALAGKAAVFDVTAKSLEKPDEVVVDDALATKMGFESLEKLRDGVLQTMQRELDQMARLRVKRELLDVLAEKADFPAPQNLVEAEFNAIWQRVEQDMRSGQVDEEDKDKDPETLRAEYRAIADRRVRLGLLLSEIGRAANIQVSQAEITNALRQEASRYPGQEMQVVEFFRKTPGAIEQLRGPIFEDKVVDYILEMAKVEDRIVEPAELALPPADPLGAPQKIEFSAAEEAVAEEVVAEEVLAEEVMAEEVLAEAAVEPEVEALPEPNAEFDAVLAQAEPVHAEAAPAEATPAEPPVEDSVAQADHTGEAA